MRARSIRASLWMALAFGAAACGPARNGDDAATDASRADVRDGSVPDAPGTQDVAHDVPVKQHDVPAVDVPGDDVPSSDVPTTDVPVGDVPATDATVLDVPAVDVPVVDVVTDVPTTDVPATDVADAGPIDAPVVTDPCAPASIIDLATAGTLSGGITRYTGSNAGAAMTGTIEGGCGGGGYQIAFSYTLHAAAILHVSTDNPGTPDDFDTVVTALDHCSPTGATLGCNDDGHMSSRSNASTFDTGTPLPAGTTVYIIVGGYVPPVTGFVPTGPFVLTVNENVSVAPGGACDPTGVSTTCAAGSVCTTSGGTSTCVAAGSLGGGCRTTGALCDTGLVCSQYPISGPRHCVQAVPAGGACDPTGVASLCASQYGCFGSGTTGTCRTYTQTPVTAPTLIDACALGTVVNTTTADDGHSTAALTVPFTFSLFGQPYTQLWPDTNGFIALGSDAPNNFVGMAGVLPSFNESEPLLAPLWDDLVIPTGGHLCVATTGSTPNRNYVIEYAGVTRFSHPAVSLTFEVVLHEDNTFDYVYTTLNPTTGTDAQYANGSQATIGIQSHGNAVMHTGTLTAPTALHWAVAP